MSDREGGGAHKNGSWFRGKGGSSAGQTQHTGVFIGGEMQQILNDPGSSICGLKPEISRAVGL